MLKNLVLHKGHIILKNKYLFLKDKITKESSLIRTYFEFIYENSSEEFEQIINSNCMWPFK